METGASLCSGWIPRYASPPVSETWGLRAGTVSLQVSPT